MNGNIVEPSSLEKAVLRAAKRLQAARRRGRTPNRIRLIDTVSGLFDELSSGQRLFIVNKVAKSFSELAIARVAPRPEQVLACWELAYREENDLNALRELVEAKTNGTEMQEKAEAWRTAREDAERRNKSVGAANLNETERLVSLTKKANLAAQKQHEALGELVKLISPGNQDLEIEDDYVSRLAPDTHRPKAESEKRLRGLKPDGAKIRQCRTSKEWSRKQFLEEISAVTGEELSIRTIARTEDGQPSDRRTLVAIASTLELTLDEIVVD